MRVCVLFPTFMCSNHRIFISTGPNPMECFHMYDGAFRARPLQQAILGIVSGTRCLALESLGALVKGLAADC